MNLTNDLKYDIQGYFMTVLNTEIDGTKIEDITEDIMTNTVLKLIFDKNYTKNPTREYYIKRIIDTVSNECCGPIRIMSVSNIYDTHRFKSIEAVNFFSDSFVEFANTLDVNKPDNEIIKDNILFVSVSTRRFLIVSEDLWDYIKAKSSLDLLFDGKTEANT